jgi:hypothetical protein
MQNLPVFANERTNAVRHVSIPRKLGGLFEMRRAFEECVAATGKVSNALNGITSSSSQTREDFRVRAEHVGRHAGRMRSLRQPIFTAWSDASLHQVLSKMFRTVSVAGEEVVKTRGELL